MFNGHNVSVTKDEYVLEIIQHGAYRQKYYALCTKKIVKRVDLMLSVLTRGQTNQKPKGYKETFGGDGCVVMVSKGICT